MKNIINKITQQKRLLKDELIALYDLDLLELGQLSNAIRQSKHNNNIVTYIIDRNINYTNICSCKCKFCAFYKSCDDNQGYVLTTPILLKKIAETTEFGGNQIMIQGGLNSELGIEYYKNLLTTIKTNFSTLWIHGFSPPEIVHISKVSHISIKDIISQLKTSGLDSIPGGGAEILVDRVRNLISPNKCNSAEWLQVMENAHNLQMRTTATMMYGHLETIEERIEHLLKIRDLQDKTKGFTAFIPWPFQPKNTQINILPNNAVDYLKTLAISRIALDNIDNIQASWVTQGSKIAQLALMFGANDMGSTMIEENVVKAAGVEFRLSEKQIKELICQAGFVPKTRNMMYQMI